MRFRALPSVDHPRVHLRPLAESDMRTWSEYLNLPEVYKHTSWNRPGLEELSSYLGNEADREPASRLRLAIALRDGGRLVGTTGFHTVSPANRSAELAYDLHPSVWGMGIATCVATAMVAWAHSEAALVRVQATVLESNARSIRVLERSGFAREGLLRAYRFVRGKPGNFYMYSHIGPLARDA